jgi:hypothetical protein
MSEHSTSEAGAIAFRAHGGRRIRVLAHGGWSERHLVQSEPHLYWTDRDDGTITRLPKDGGIPLILATEQKRPGPLALAGGFLWWANQDTIVRMPAAGGDVEILAEGQEWPRSIAVHGDTVAWTTFGDGLATGTVCVKAPGEPHVTIATKQKQPSDIVIDAEQIWWANHGVKRPTYFRDGSVVRKPRDGGKKRFVIAKDQAQACSIIVDDEHVHWMTAASYDAPYLNGRLWKRRKAGGKATAIACWDWRDSAAIVFDATHAYILAHLPPRLYRVPREGGELEQLMSSENTSIYADALVVDDRCVYWTVRNSQEAGGAVFKMGK